MRVDDVAGISCSSLPRGTVQVAQLAEGVGDERVEDPQRGALRAQQRGACSQRFLVLVRGAGVEGLAFRVWV